MVELSQERCRLSARSGSWSVASSPPPSRSLQTRAPHAVRSLCSHDAAASSQKHCSFLGRQRERTAESLFLDPRVHPDETFTFPLLFTIFAPPPLISSAGWCVRGGQQQQKEGEEGEKGFPINAGGCFFDIVFAPGRKRFLTIFRTVSSVRQVDDRHPLIQAAAVPAESVHLAKRWVLPQGRLRVLQVGEKQLDACWGLFFEHTIQQTSSQFGVRNDTYRNQDAVHIHGFPSRLHPP